MDGSVDGSTDAGTVADGATGDAGSIDGPVSVADGATGDANALVPAWLVQPAQSRPMATTATAAVDVNRWAVTAIPFIVREEGPGPGSAGA